MDEGEMYPFPEQIQQTTTDYSTEIKKLCNCQAQRCFLTSCIQPFPGMRWNRGLKKSKSHHTSILINSVPDFTDIHINPPIELSYSKKAHNIISAHYYFTIMYKGSHDSFLNVKVVRKSSALNSPACTAFSFCICVSCSLVAEC